MRRKKVTNKLVNFIIIRGVLSTKKINIKFKIRWLIVSLSIKYHNVKGKVKGREGHVLQLFSAKASLEKLVSIFF